MNKKGRRPLSDNRQASAAWRKIPNLKFNPMPITDEASRRTVKDCLEHFNVQFDAVSALYRADPKKWHAENKKNSPKPKKQKKGQKVKQPRCRIFRADLKAMEAMGQNGSMVNQELIAGHVPGVNVNDTFKWRAEIKVIGLHNKHMSGIDFVPESIAGRGKSVALAIVQSGSYEDDNDGEEVIWYTGEGGNNLLGNRQQMEDQKLVRGNLALYNNWDMGGPPVRVIKRNGDKFIYDGLWDVCDMVQKKGISNSDIYIFKLVRQKQQESSVAKLVQFGEWTFLNKKYKPKSPPSTPFINKGLVIWDDISNGLEPVPIPVVNECDEELPPGLSIDQFRKFKPELMEIKEWREHEYVFEYGVDFKYVGVEVPKAPKLPKIPDVHDYVLQMNHGTLMYIEGACELPRLICPTAIVQECGPWLNCPKGVNCLQAASQRPFKWKLQIFKTAEKGWGVRALELIPEGVLIGTYIGEVLPIDDMCKDDPYSFNLEQRLDRGFDHRTLDEPIKSDADYVVTGRHYGNFYRFINHSCNPNCFVQPVLSHHTNRDIPKICLFTMGVIHEGQELTYDYFGGVGIEDHLPDGCKCDECASASKTTRKRRRLKK